MLRKSLTESASRLRPAVIDRLTASSKSRTIKPEFLVLLPLHRPPALLEFAVESVLAQTDQSFELHIICDGAPSATQADAKALEQQHECIPVHIRPKGDGNAEAHRDLVIGASSAPFICQFTDDDIWYPCHLEEMRQLLEYP